MKKKVAVIGSGVGAITAVYALTQTNNWQNKYDITVYQLGWRSGGKGASGRNAKYGQRIEEHGLHVWAGFYDNAFRNMRHCYEQLVSLGLRDPSDPLGTMDKAFKPLSHLFLAEYVPDSAGDPNAWRPWIIDLPMNDKVPGTETKVPSPFEMMLHVLEIMIEYVEKGEVSPGIGNDLGFHFPKELLSPKKAIRSFAKTLNPFGHQHKASHLNILADLIADAQQVVHDLQAENDRENDALRRGLELADIAFAFMYGIVTSDTFVGGYDVLDQWEFSDWLRMNGASDQSVASVPVRGCYDFVFGFNNGMTSQPGDVGAGTAIRAMSRLIFTYSTAIFHKMQAGMGDTIFAPYYQVLSALGVKFEFFCAARELHLDADGTNIEKLSMVRQAQVKDGPYQPLVDVKGLPCWPSEPIWSQLVDGDALKASGVDFECEKGPPTGTPFTLERGQDFDIVILGASIGSLPYMTKKLSDASVRWKTMLDRVKTVGTHAAQFWLTEQTDDLGWRHRVEAHNNGKAIPPSPLRTVITGFAEPLDTWADMSHLIPHEDWPANAPQSLAYFCAPAPDGEDLEAFEKGVADWQDKDLCKLWPNSNVNGRFEPSLFFDGNDAGRYMRVNMYGSERYVLSVTNSVYYRLAPDESGFANLYLAGDWTRCGLNAGCVEAATMSGIAAASAISGEKLLNVGADDIDRSGTVLEEAVYATNSISGTAWPLAPFFARGEMTGWFIFYEMKREEVAAMLPDDIHLGYAPTSRPGYHPVGMSFCHYQNVRGSFVPDFMAMSPYGEATFAIPYTHSDEGGGAPYLYPRQLYVNNNTAIQVGKLCYAMNKAKADIEVENTHFIASDPGGLSIDARFEQHQLPMPVSSHHAHGTISNFLDMSFLTRRKSGKLLYNAFNLQLDRAYLAPVHGQIRVTDPNPNGFADADLTVTPLQNRTHQTLPGAFRIWCSWSMTNPFDSKRIRHANAARYWVERLSQPL